MFNALPRLIIEVWSRQIPLKTSLPKQTCLIIIVSKYWLLEVKYFSEDDEDDDEEEDDEEDNENDNDESVYEDDDKDNDEDDNEDDDDDADDDDDEDDGVKDFDEYVDDGFWKQNTVLLLKTMTSA